MKHSAATGFYLMKMARASTAVFILALAIGCKTTGPTFDPRSNQAGAEMIKFVSVGETNQIKPEWLMPPKKLFRLGPGDKIEIEVIGMTGSRTTTFICPDGKIYYDLLPGLEVWGLTLPEVKQLLETKLAAYYQHPQVAVNLRGVESKRIWVLGRLNKCGLFPLNGPMTVIEAIAQAGGLFTSRFSGTTEELADLNHSFLIRNGEMLPVNFKRLLREGDTSQNVYLEPDDFLFLPSSLSQEVYVLGAVNRPAPMGFVDNMSLASAIAKALGTQPEAQLSHVAIVRGALAEPKIAIVDFAAIMSGRQPDVRLEPHDIIFVPATPYRTLERYTKMITDTFVRTVAANEGGHAGARSFQGIGVSNQIR
ncbi:MAG: polysaccharide biosynthesis/export family protein [Verrucomicrobiota bacterium]